MEKKNENENEMKLSRASQAALNFERASVSPCLRGEIVFLRLRGESICGI
jgi:hypothetical protein